MANADGCAHDGGEWQGVLSDLAAEISSDMSGMVAAGFETGNTAGSNAGSSPPDGSTGEASGKRMGLMESAKRKKAELAGQAEQWAKELEVKGGLASVVRADLNAVGDSMTGIGIGLSLSIRSMTAKSYRLHLIEGEILLAPITIDVMAKDGTLISLLHAIRERVGVSESIALTMNLAVIDDIAQLPCDGSTATVRFYSTIMISLLKVTISC